MTAQKNDTKRLPPEREWRLKRFAIWFEPYGILIAVTALVVALATLWMEIDLRSRTLIVLEEERQLRRKTLTAMGEERTLRNRTLAALEDDKELREASLLSMLLERFDVAREERTPYAGHVPILERLARIGMDLRNIDATAVDFSVDGGINLNDANLSHMDFGGSDLSRAQLANTNLNQARFRRASLLGANLQHANLTQAKLGEANLRRANLVGAVLERTTLRKTNVSEVNFKDARGLRQKTLDTACANPEEPPVNLPNDSRTGNQLVWRGQPCEE